jgi:hypothetical protein
MESVLLSLMLLGPVNQVQASCNPCKCHIPRPAECSSQEPTRPQPRRPGTPPKQGRPIGSK